MTKIRLVEIGEFYKDTLNNKWLLKGNPKVDFSSQEYTGKVLIDEKGNRVGKILDVIGNVNEPYVLVMPISNSKPEGKLYVEFKEKRKGGRRK
ncbi:Gar1/Naf1 family protein [Sulfurisphaera javensis]|uniref:Gar1/Naf1 family protein n=1 Tax=Sulfurisphaera javensis TaxID=2049879 RepID=A0AAT9GTY2_9CREN